MQKTRTVSAARVAIVAAAAMFAFWSRDVRPQTASCLVTTFSGVVQGVDNGSSCAFLSIPFAAPPVGELRWKPPQPSPPWAPAVLNAKAPPPTCAQFNLAQTIVGSEDCLKLNIWTPHPVPAKPAPVIVWIHTGAFQATSANFPAHNGQRLAEKTGAIVVAANYRLGPFGFMGHAALTAEDPGYRSSANYGFLDQRAALSWVRDHITAFGGDANNVTIGGQSAGAHSVGLHMVSPGSAGYFSRAIMQSGYASTRWRTLADAQSVGNDFAAALGCTDPAQVLTCMRGATRNQVMLALAALPAGLQRFVDIPSIAWGPVVDGLDIPDQPRTLYEDGKFNRVPLMIGATRDEGWTFVARSFPGDLTPEQYQAAVETEFGAADAPATLAQYPAADFPSPKHALSRLTGDVEYVCEARRVARFVSRTGTPVYEYSFQREVDAVVPDLVIHGLDTNFVFGNNYGPPAPYVLDADDLALFGSMSGYWTRFAATGNPNPRRSRQEHDRRRGYDDDDDDEEAADGVVRWPAFRHSSGKRRSADRYIVLNVPIRQDKRLREEQCNFWEPFFLGTVIGSQTAVQASQAPDLCGASISSDLKLDRDLTCAGTGLSVAADGIRIRLNGHSITGSGTGAGIDITGRNDVRISGGTIRNFEAGVRVNDATGVVVRGNQLLDNNDGVDLQAGSVGNTIEENAFRDNRARGVMLRSNSRDNLVEENTFTGNRVGILLFGALDSTVKENIVSASILAGIRINVVATGNRVSENTVFSNPAGIDFLITPTGSAIGNRVDENTITMNACGLKGPTAGNRLDENRFEQNTVDVCP
jgi:para-nitrobenzyl esterase